MNNWKEYKLGDLVAINERSIGKNYRYERVEYIDTSSVTENKFETPIYSAITEAPSRAKRLIADGDTIISTVRPIQKHYGFIKKAKGNQVVSTGFAVVTPKSIEPRFLYYFLTQAKITEYLNTIAEGGTTTFPAFKPDELKELSICLPNRDTQAAIAEILSSLDDKIELNNKINQELESLAQLLFKHWFVDFEFPNENGEPYKSSGCDMIDSELGVIPKGWRLGIFGELVDVINGYAFKSKDFDNSQEEGIVKIKNINGLTVDIKNTDFVSSNVVSNLNRKFKINSGDILIAMTGAEVGKIGVVPETKQNLWLNQRVGKVVPKDVKNTSFIHTLYNFLNLTDVVKNEAMGSAQPNISSTGIESIKIMIPSQVVIEEFSRIFNDKYFLFVSSLAEIQTLSELRDTILPKLISGELQIKENQWL